jgi:hypothetical protein
MFGTFKLSLNENIVTFFGLVTVLATFSKIWANFFLNLLVTLAPAYYLIHIYTLVAAYY